MPRILPLAALLVAALASTPASASITVAPQKPSVTADAVHTAYATLMAQGKLPADPTLTKLFGTGGLLTDGFRSGYQNSNYRKALQTNTLLGWAPKRPMVLCAGGQDPTVFFFNTTDVQADFASRGATVPAWSLENRASMPAGAAFDTAYGGFQLAKAAAGANAQAQYHGGLVPPFCHALARGYFQQVLASGQ